MSSIRMTQEKLIPACVCLAETCSCSMKVVAVFAGAYVALRACWQPGASVVACCCPIFVELQCCCMQGAPACVCSAAARPSYARQQAGLARQPAAAAAAGVLRMAGYMGEPASCWSTSCSSSTVHVVSGFRQGAATVCKGCTPRHAGCSGKHSGSTQCRILQGCVMTQPASVTPDICVRARSIVLHAVARLLLASCHGCPCFSVCCVVLMPEMACSQQCWSGHWPAWQHMRSARGTASIGLPCHWQCAAQPCAVHDSLFAFALLQALVPRLCAVVPFHQHFFLQRLPYCQAMRMMHQGSCAGPLCRSGTG